LFNKILVSNVLLHFYIRWEIYPFGSNCGPYIKRWFPKKYFLTIEPVMVGKNMNTFGFMKKVNRREIIILK